MRLGIVLILWCCCCFMSVCCGQTATESTLACNVESFNKLREMENVVKALERIQANIDKVKKQLEVISESKIMKIGITEAFEILGNDTEIASTEFTSLFEKAKNELAQIVILERELTIKKRVLEISEAILESKDDTIRSSYLAKMSYSFKEENCKCFDVISGNSCDRSGVSTSTVATKSFGNSNVFALAEGSYTPKSCREYYESYNNGTLASGPYQVRPTIDIEPFIVYCDMRGGWTYLNGVSTSTSPASVPVPPILPSTVNSAQFQGVLTTVTEIKSSLGDRCVLDVKNIEIRTYEDNVMNDLCRGVAYFTEGISFIKYFAK